MKEFLYDHAALSPVSFHMPGHKGSMLFEKYGYEKFLGNFMDMDVTEIPGTDNLFDADGIIEDVQRRYAGLYGARRSWLSVGGTSVSLIASIMAVLDHAAVEDKKTGADHAPKMIIARNCHRSVFNGLALAGGEPVYAYPDIIDRYGVSGEVNCEEIERCIRQAPDAAGVVVTSPNYYGFMSDIEKIAKIVHRAGKILIVDQAHGAHLKFFHKYGCEVSCIPQAAEDLGADIVCNSTHKTLASMTQSAVLNLCSDRIDPELIDEKLQMIESSSPSYVLMTSLDINADLIEKHGKELFEKWRSDLEWFYDKAADIPGLKMFGREICADRGKMDSDKEMPMFDLTKINIDMGIAGSKLESKLNERGIFPELNAGNILMCMTGIGNTHSDYEKLLAELQDISEELQRAGQSIDEDPAGNSLFETESSSVAEDNVLPRSGRMRSVPKTKKKVLLADSEGCVCARSVIPYPPGSPIICPGEEMTGAIISYLEKLIRDGHKITGIDKNGCIKVGAD